MTTYISRSLIEHARDFDIALSKAPTDFYRYSGGSITQYLFTFQKPGIGSVMMQSRVPCTYFVYGGIVPYLDVMDGNENFPETEIFRVVCDHAAFCNDTDRFGLSLDDLKAHASSQSSPIYDRIQEICPVYRNIPLVGYMHSILSSIPKSADQGIVWLSEHGVRYYYRSYGLEVSYSTESTERYIPYPVVSVSPTCREHGLYVYTNDDWLVSCDKSQTPLCVYTDRTVLRCGEPRYDFFGKDLSLICEFTIHVPRAEDIFSDGTLIPFPKTMKLKHKLIGDCLRLCYQDESGNDIQSVLCNAPCADSLSFDIVPFGLYRSSVIGYFRNGFEGMISLYRDASDAKFMCVSLDAVNTQDLSDGFRRMSPDNNKPVCVRFFSRIN